MRNEESLSHTWGGAETNTVEKCKEGSRDTEEKDSKLEGIKNGSGASWEGWH